MRAEIAEEETCARKPTRGNFAVCCACAARSQKGNVRTNAKIQIHFGFWILVAAAPFRLPEYESETRFEETTFMRLPSQSPIHNQNSKCHLMTLSALASTFGGIVRPICLAGLRL